MGAEVISNAFLNQFCKVFGYDIATVSAQIRPHLGRLCTLDVADLMNYYRREDLDAFLRVCKEGWPPGGTKRNLMLAFRRPSVYAKQWIGKRVAGRELTSKPQVIKPKSANNGPLAGLVVDPTKREEAFTAGRLGQAEDAWNSFLEDFPPERHRAGPYYAGAGKPSEVRFYDIDEDEASKFYGCILLWEGGKHKYVHSDYDLAYIYTTHDKYGQKSDERSIEYDQVTTVRPEWKSVSDRINKEIGVPMIRHGSQYAWKPVHRPDNPEGNQAQAEAVDLFFPHPLWDRLIHFQLPPQPSAGEYTGRANLLVEFALWQLLRPEKETPRPPRR